jgi:hypothetical protein
MTITSNDTAAEVRLGPPDPSFPPLKTNVFELVRGANSELAPLFPYLHPGAFVPAGALMMGAEGSDYGRFFHRNTQEEVVVCWGAHDDFFQPGMLAVNGKMHEVSAIIVDPGDPASFMLGVITQRQAESGEQAESVIFRCSECNEKLHQHSYDATPEEPALDRDGEHFPGFATITKSLVAADRYNQEVAGNPCPKCGHVAERFPVERWGWDEWSRRHRFVNEGWRSLARATAELSGESETPA